VFALALVGTGGHFPLRLSYNVYLRHQAVVSLVACNLVLDLAGWVLALLFVFRVSFCVGVI